jgi:hypothetical protein
MGFLDHVQSTVLEAHQDTGLLCENETSRSQAG